MSRYRHAVFAEIILIDEAIDLARAQIRIDGLDLEVGASQLAEDGYRQVEPLLRRAIETLDSTRLC